MASRMQEKYKAEVFPALKEKFQYKNVMEVPKLEKITLNMGLGDVKDNKLKKNLKITIPEELDYTEVFDDLMEEYTTSSELVAVKSTNMGSMFKLNYEIKLKDASKEKEFVDKLRCRNGNLEILVSKVMQTESYL